MIVNPKPSWGGWFFWIGIVTLSSFYDASFAQETSVEKKTPPEPMTLQYALAQASRASSAQALNIAAQKQITQAKQDLTDSSQGVFVNINGQLRYVKPSPVQPNRTNNDSKISLNISKQLYDFGRTQAKLDASEAELEAVDALYSDVISERKVAILKAYFNVLLADIRYSHQNEAMAIDFIQLDKLRSRVELGQISEIDMMAVENKYRHTRRERNKAAREQRSTRSILAQLISPGHLSNELEEPELDKLVLLSSKRELPELEKLYQTAWTDNPQMQAMDKKIASAKMLVNAHKAEKNPVINAKFEAAEYERYMGGTDKLRAIIELNIPIYQAGQETAQIKRALGEVKLLESKKIELHDSIEQQILDVWLLIRDIKQQFDDPDFTLDYRDLYLERSRALYELEVKSDIGDAMVQLTAAQLFKAQTVFDLAIAWAKLDALTGKTMNYYESE